MFKSLGPIVLSASFLYIYTKGTESIDVAIKTLRDCYISRIMCIASYMPQSFYCSTAFDVSKEFANECITAKRFDHPNVLSLIGTV